MHRCRDYDPQFMHMFSFTFCSCISAPAENSTVLKGRLNGQNSLTCQCVITGTIQAHFLQIKTAYAHYFSKEILEKAQ